MGIYVSERFIVSFLVTGDWLTIQLYERHIMPGNTVVYDSE